MALRSSLSAVRAAAPAPASENDEAETPAASAPVAAAPIAVASPSAGRGRPSGAKDTKPRAARSSVKAAVENVVAMSARDLRQALKGVEAEAAEVKDAITAATAKLQPKIDALRARHAELSKQLADHMFK